MELYEMKNWLLKEDIYDWSKKIKNAKPNQIIAIYYKRRDALNKEKKWLREKDPYKGGDPEWMMQVNNMSLKTIHEIYEKRKEEIEQQKQEDNHQMNMYELFDMSTN